MKRFVNGVVAIAFVLMCGTAHAYKIKTKKIDIKKPNERYELSVAYPEIRDMKDTAVQDKLNQLFYQWAQNRIQKFDNERAELERDEVLDKLPGGNALNISFVVKLQDDKRLGIVWDIYQNFVGSAHPNEMLNPIMYDVTTGTVITLADLFKPKTPYLKVISKLCREQLNKSFAGSGFELFEDGLKPKPENYVNFLMRPEGLYFIFNPYQVAPYVAGIQEVVIPYAPLMAYMKP